MFGAETLHELLIDSEAESHVWKHACDDIDFVAAFCDKTLESRVQEVDNFLGVENGVIVVEIIGSRPEL